MKIFGRQVKPGPNAFLEYERGRLFFMGTGIGFLSPIPATKVQAKALGPEIGHICKGLLRETGESFKKSSSR